MAVSYLRVESGHHTILDVGCGLGMQSIISAMLGASVVGVDIRDDCIRLCEKRQAFYEGQLGRPLDAPPMSSSSKDLRLLILGVQVLFPIGCGEE